jgi:lysophospholipase
MTLVALAKNPIPGGVVTGHIKGYDGKALRFARWNETRGPRRGTVCILPGRSEFIEKYFEVVADLRRRGFSVAIMDLRGQGGSERLLDDPMKGHIRHFREYEQDLACFMREIVLPDCPPPFLAFGHSLGGHILLRHASQPGSWFQRIVLSAPMIEISRFRASYSQATMRAYAEICCTLGLSRAYVIGGKSDPLDGRGFEDNLFTSDRNRFDRTAEVLEAAPHLALGGPTIGWLRAACRSMAILQSPDYPSSVTVPILMVAAGQDRVVSTTAVEEFALRLKVGSHVMIAGSRHEILMETDNIRARFWAAFDAYLGVSAVAA